MEFFFNFLVQNSTVAKSCIMLSYEFIFQFLIDIPYVMTTEGKNYVHLNALWFHKCFSTAAKYNIMTAEHVCSLRSAAPQVVNTNPLDAMDFTSPEFRGEALSRQQLLSMQ